MRGVQQARIGLFLVLIATGVVIGHVLAIGISDARRQPVFVSESEFAPDVSLASLEGDDAPGYVTLASLEESDCCAGGVVTASGCPGCPSASCATANCPPKIYIGASLTSFQMIDDGPELVSSSCCADESDKESFTVVSGGPEIVQEAESHDCIASHFPILQINVSPEGDCAAADACDASSDGVTACSNEVESASCDAEKKSCACCAAKAKVAACAGECPACPGGSCSADSACETAAAECDAEHCAGEAQQVAEDVPTPPDALRAPDDATPIVPDALINSDEILVTPKSDARKEAELRSIIESELPLAREDERAIWLEELKGLPPEMVRELLRLRNDFNGGEQGHLADVVAPAPPMLAHEGRRLHKFHDEAPSLTQLFDRSKIEMQLEPSREAIEQASQVVINNIVNANTVGFKRAIVSFSDTGYQQLQIPGKADGAASAAPVGISIGGGVKITSTTSDHTQGHLKKTGRMLDLAIDGEGFFQVKNAAGEVVYTRAGAFSRNADGLIVVSSSGVGRTLEPAIQVPANAGSISISSEGAVTVLEPGKPSSTTVGQIQLVKFPNPEGLLPLGESTFGATEGAGVPQIGGPALEGRGKLQQRYLEESNVSLATETQALQKILEQMNALEQTASMLTPGLTVPIDPAPGQIEPSDEPAPGGRFTRRPPQQTSEHIRPDRAKR